MKNKELKENKKKRKHRLFKLILGGLFLKLFCFLFKNRKKYKENLDEFIGEEKREIKELERGEESFKKFCCDSGSLMADYFIPNHGNEHKPKILRTKSLVTIAAVLLFVKVAVTGYLFFIYPNQARMAEAIVQKIFELTNYDRVANNISPLRTNEILNNSASAKAHDMITNNYFAHYSPTGVKPWDWINRAEYPYLLVGENLAMNFNTAEAVHKALMNSESHKKNILNPKYDEIGLAMLSGEINGRKTNVLVELFAVAKKEKAVVPVVAVEEEKAEEAKTTEEEKQAEEIVPEENDTAVLGIKEEEKAEEIIKEKEIIKEEPASVPSERDSGVAKEEKIIAPVAEIKEESNIAPGAEMANINAKVSYVEPVENSKLSLAAVLVNGAKYLYLAVLIIMTAALLINIFVRITIQHKPVIIQTLVFLLFVAGLISVKLHILESVLDGMAII